MILTVRVLVISSRGTEPTLNGVLVETVLRTVTK